MRILKLKRFEINTLIFFCRTNRSPCHLGWCSNCFVKKKVAHTKFNVTPENGYIVALSIVWPLLFSSVLLYLPEGAGRARSRNLHFETGSYGNGSSSRAHFRL